MPSYASARERAPALWLPIAAFLLFAQPGTAGAEVVSLPVEFDIVNRNGTQIDCEADGVPYTVRGHLTGARAVLAGPGPHAVTLYTYGFDGGEWNWRFQAVAGYDLPAALATAGHISVSIDMIGYDASGHPDGFLSCMGSQADVHHQIVEQLRSGTYRVPPGSPFALPFDQVVLAAHDVSGAMVELQAYTWQEDADALVLLTWADQGLGPAVLERIPETRQICADGGEPAEDGDPDSPGGYYFFGPDDDRFGATLLAHAEDEVVEAVLALRNRNPCGYAPSIVPTMANNKQRTSEIEVPVLLMLGEDDPAFLQAGWQAQQFAYGTDDVEAILIPNASHFPMLEASAPFVHDTISAWLCQRGLRSAGAGGDCVVRDEPVPGGKASGGGWLESNDGRKLNFGFNAEHDADGPSGQLKLHDKAAGVKIQLSEMTAVGSVAGECGSIEPSAASLELRGRGSFNGRDAEFRVCVADRGEPGNSRASATPDLFYLECRSGCAYDTLSRAPDDALDGGNLQVHAPAPAQPATGGEGAEPAVLVLDPVLLGAAPIGTSQLLTVSVYDPAGEPLPGSPISLAREGAAAGSTLALEALTGPAGQVQFPVAVGAGENAFIARSGEIESNAVEITGTAE